MGMNDVEKQVGVETEIVRKQKGVNTEREQTRLPDTDEMSYDREVDRFRVLC